MSGLHVVTGDAPAALLAQLDADLAEAPISPFDDDVIVVQSLGMERWVRQQLARRRGCAASIALPFPAAYCRDLAQRLQQDPQMAGIGSLDSRFSETPLTWQVFAALQDQPLLQQPDCAPLRPYLDRADDRARFGLARSITARFDEYRLYRPEMVIGWEAGTLQTTTDAERWQAAVWRHITRGEAPTHFARWFTATVDRLERAEVQPAGLPARLAVFGVSTLPPLFVRLLAAIARFVPVSVYVLLPDGAQDASSGGRPAAAAFTSALGSSARELVADLTRHAATRTGSRRTVLARPWHTPDALLQRLQADACHPATAQEAWTVSPDDRSLSVHECHAPLRELEVLRDYLLDAFAADPTLRPHDVLVMVPDVEVYAPLAESVFGNEHDGLPRLPFRVADRTLVREATPAGALRLCLDLVTSRCTASELLNLLLMPPVRRAARIPGVQFDRLVAWVQQAGIRWGESGTARANEYALPAVEDHTWRLGLDRLLTGYATGTVDGLVHGVRPLAGDVSGDVELLGAFVQWVDRIFAWRAGARHARTLPEWQAHLREVCGWLLDAETPEETSAMAALLAVVDSLHEGTALSASSAAVPVSFDVLRDWLLGTIDSHEQASGFLTGGMTLCAMKPMRAIPHRIIAMLGLSDDAFPRRQRRTAFDLIGLSPERGDRDVRADDRQLMLDTMLCAESRLVLSYVARSQVDNRELAPSIVVAELLEHLDARCLSANGAAARESVIWRHRLQPFSPAYFGALPAAERRDTQGGPHTDPRLFTFDRGMADAVRAAQAHARDQATQSVTQGASPFLTQLPIVPPLVDGRRLAASAGAASAGATLEPERIAVADLLEAWRHPARWYARRVLALDVSGGADAVDDVEPLGMDPLRKVRLQQAMLDRALRTEPLDAAFQQFVLAGGELPPANLGAAWYASLQQDLYPLLHQVATRVHQPSLPVHVAGADWIVHGMLEGQVDGGQWRVRAARLKPADRLHAWMLHVVRSAQVGTGSTWVYGTDKAIRLEALPDALAQMDVLVQGYRIINALPVPFFVDSAWRYREGVERGTLDREALIQAFLDRGEYGPPGDAHDPWVAVLWRGWHPLEVCWDSFAAWCDMFWRGYQESAA